MLPKIKIYKLIFFVCGRVDLILFLNGEKEEAEKKKLIGNNDSHCLALIIRQKIFKNIS